MAYESAKTLVRIAWMYGNTEELLRGFHSSFKKMPTLVGKNLKYGYWEENEPHYLLIASHNSDYERPTTIKSTDYNFMVTITSRDDMVNTRVLSEFSGRVQLQAAREPQSETLRNLMYGVSLVYPIFERYGNKAFDNL